MSEASAKWLAALEKSNKRELAKQALLLATLPTVGFVLFGSTGRDDTHITFWAAHALSSFGSIVNVNGERVEQSSSLLFTLLLAAIERVTRANLAAIAAILSILFGVVTVVLTGRLASKLRPGIERPAMLLAALSPPLVYWSFSGMETTLHACLLLGLVLETIRLLEGTEKKAALRRLAVLVPLFVLVRPETAITTGASLVAIAALLVALHRGSVSRARGSLVALGWLALGVACAAGALMLFRKAYFGTAFPQTVIAKSQPFDGRTLGQGLIYLYKQAVIPVVGVLAFLGVVALAHRAGGMLRTEAREPDRAALTTLVITGFLAAHVAFVVTVGGDWMELGRFVVAPLPFVIVLAADELGAPERGRAAVVVLTALSLACLVVVSVAPGPEWGSTGSPLWKRAPVEAPPEVSWFERTNRAHADDLEVIPEVSSLIEAAFAKEHRPIVVFSGQAGMVMYYLGKHFYGSLTYVDARGLATRHITGCDLGVQMRRTDSGMVMPYEEYFRRPNAFAKACGIPVPDVIFDFVGVPQQRFLAGRGYDLVFQSRGNEARHSEQVFVRRGLLQAPVEN